mmetsp:Transcript_32088/g.53024  ORF Transcript_32088/g.53024 Transcript_32088/m.53024 type:complete len:308 (+) Transcript_32088:679-1602(+)
MPLQISLETFRTLVKTMELLWAVASLSSMTSQEHVLSMVLVKETAFPLPPSRAVRPYSMWNGQLDPRQLQCRHQHLYRNCHRSLYQMKLCREMGQIQMTGHQVQVPAASFLLWLLFSSFFSRGGIALKGIRRRMMPKARKRRKLQHLNSRVRHTANPYREINRKRKGRMTTTTTKTITKMNTTTTTMMASMVRATMKTTSSVKHPNGKNRKEVAAVGLAVVHVIAAVAERGRRRKRNPRRKRRSRRRVRVVRERKGTMTTRTKVMATTVTMKATGATRKKMMTMMKRRGKKKSRKEENGGGTKKARR